MREFLKGLFEDDTELIDTIMAEYGKLVTKDKEELQTLRSEVQELKENSKNANEFQQKYEELKKEKDEREAKEKAEEQDKELTDSINELFEGKTFTSEYARNGLLNDIKKGLSDPNNEGKNAKDLFKELTKDKTDIFTNPNQIKDMEGMGESEENTNTKEMPIMW